VARPRPKARAASGAGAILVLLPPNRTNRNAAPAHYVRIDHTAYQPANCASVILTATGSRVKVKLRSKSTRRKTGASRCGDNPAYLYRFWKSRRADSNRLPAHYELAVKGPPNTVPSEEWPK
jgi:hypothetical protein